MGSGACAGRCGLGIPSGQLSAFSDQLEDHHPPWALAQRREQAVLDHTAAQHRIFQAGAVNHRDAPTPMTLRLRMPRLGMPRLGMPAAKNADGQGVAPAADRCYGPADRSVGVGLYGLTEGEIGIVEEGRSLATRLPPCPLCLCGSFSFHHGETENTERARKCDSLAVKEGRHELSAISYQLSAIS